MNGEGARQGALETANRLDADTLPPASARAVRRAWTLAFVSMLNAAREQLDPAEFDVLAAAVARAARDLSLRDAA